MVSKLRLFVILIICGSVVLLITHLSVFNKKSFRLVNSVNVFTHNHFNENQETRQFEQNKQNRPINDAIADKDTENKNKESFRKHGENVPVVNVKVDETNIKNAEETDSEKHNTETKQVTESVVNINKNVVKKGPLGKKEEKKEDISKLPPCSKRGVNLVGPLFIDQTIPKKIEDVEKILSVDFGGTVENGGWWEPTTCKPRVKVAIIIPYRNRLEQLKIFLRHMHPYLQRQQIYYRIIVVDQLLEDPFNRAGLFNVGFVEALKLADFDCFVFTDVDLLPEDDRNYYGCPTSPRHMSVGVDKFNYKLPYHTIFGGVGAFTKDDFEKINGMSNMFWGWGGEDDDLYARITQMGFKLTRPSIQIGRYTMVRIHHFQSSKADPNRMNLLQNSKQRMVADGLNTLKYNLKEVVQDPIVTYVRVEMKRSMYMSNR